MYERLRFCHVNKDEQVLSKEVQIIWNDVSDDAVHIPMSKVQLWVEQCIKDIIRTKSNTSYTISGDTCVLVMLEEETINGNYYSVEVCKRMHTAYTKV